MRRVEICSPVHGGIVKLWMEIQGILTCAAGLMEISLGSWSFMLSLLPVGPLWDYCSSLVKQLLLAGLNATERLWKLINSYPDPYDDGLPSSSFGTASRQQEVETHDRYEGFTAMRLLGTLLCWNSIGAAKGLSLLPSDHAVRWGGRFQTKLSPGVSEYLHWIRGWCTHIYQSEFGPLCIMLVGKVNGLNKQPPVHSLHLSCPDTSHVFGLTVFTGVPGV